MKALYIPAALLAAILSFSLWTGCYTARCSEEWTQLLEQSDAAAHAESWDLALKHLQTAYDGWTRQGTFFHIVLSHDELDEAQTLFAGSFAAAEERDNEDFHIQLAQLAVQLRLLAETQSVSIRNIL